MVEKFTQHQEFKLENSSVLVIEDDIAFSEIVKYFLELHSVTCIPAYSIAEAFTKLISEQIDFVLLDGNLPDGQGVDFLNLAKDFDLHVPVMMMTAEDNQETMKDYFELGIDDYLIKPVNIELMWLKMQRLYKAYRIQKRTYEQQKRLEKMLEQKEVEENLARHVFKHLASNKYQLEHIIETSMQSSSSFNGDFFLSRQGPSGNTFMMLLDATGHGLAAAISVLPLVAIMRAMVDKGFTLPHLLHELNKKLNLEMPQDRFVAGVLVEVDHVLNRLYIWNGAMPPVLIVDRNKNLIHSIQSQHMALGILDTESFSANYQTIDLKGGEHLLMYSDGLTEQLSGNGTPFSTAALHTCIANCDKEASLLKSILNDFKAHVDGEPLNDDVSLCCVDLDKLRNHLQAQADIKCFENKDDGVISAMLKLNGAMIRKVDLLDCLSTMMKQAQVSVPMRQKAFTVLSELINNAIDHGVLKLDSVLKNQHDRFFEYLELREENLQNLSVIDEVELHFSFDLKADQILFEIHDSGNGYNPELVSVDDDTALSGRGLALIHKLAVKVDCTPPGNQTSVTIK